jgi:hypothetical protein
MGVALAQLKQKPMYQALGYESFAALCNVALHISPDHADHLITISQTFTKKQAGMLTTSKALSLVALSRALGGHHAPAALRSRRALDVGHGKTIDVTAASAEELNAVAHDLRARSGREPTRGLHVSKDEQAFVKRLAAALKSRGAEGAKVTAVAGPKSGAKMRVEIAIHDAPLLARALSDAKR